jgi:hypothetical protein
MSGQRQTETHSRTRHYADKRSMEVTPPEALAHLSSGFSFEAMQQKWFHPVMFILHQYTMNLQKG